MILPMLMNMALGAGTLIVEEDDKHVRLVTRKLGVPVVLARLPKEAVYQMTRTPDMPATLKEAVTALSESEEKVLADEPVPLPVQRPARQRPSLSVVQGGRA
ncbi:hypothetical protein B9J07_27880 [Sinorhizobium sp. LM21]|uniref:hypothetical protein n=1 Tax=Sinorhizobium sp. LM21 TaxID=1449788 RepID=UPI0005D7B40C|nr:hypothetical protein [Sinorhizobium sp. LM21]AJW30187.1 hypothetical protein pLM21S1_p67 [Sinorhizobium sp. LM21]OWZ90409.1 hypothetical protein B9J07_27880 [Sinorhizobium sp. LM21]